MPRALAFLLAAVAALAAAPGATAATRMVGRSEPDAGSCVGAPCGSFAYAYRHARAGDVVEVASGTYPAQEIPAVAGRSGAPVVFRPAPGATVRVSDLDVRGTSVTVQDVSVLDDFVDVTDASGVSIVNVSARGLWINNVRDLLVKGGSYGGINDKSPVIIGADPLSYRITFDGVDFHDAIATRQDTHDECLLAVSPQGLTIRNSIFRNCAYFGTLIATCCGGTRDPRDVLIENTVFEQTYQWNRQPAPYSMMVSGIKAENFVFRNNTFETEPAFNETTLINSRMVGNLGHLGSCQDAMTYHHNVWTSLTCSPTDTRAAGALRSFVDVAAHDWHLTPGAAAIGRGDPNDHPATDRDGFARDRRPDAGADEYGNGRATTETSPPAGSPSSGAAPGGGLRILSARLARTRICKVRRFRCRRSTRLLVKVSSAARLTASLRRADGRRKPVKRLRRSAAAGRTAVLRIDTRRLRRGRYLITLVATDARGRRAEPRALRLRVS